MKNTRKSSGITLISLIITIIVLLILAGVALNTLVGANGIITQTQSVVDKYNREAMREKASLAIVELAIKNNSGYTMADYVKNFEDGIEVGGGLIYEENEEYFYLDEDDNLIELINKNGTLEVGEVLGKNNNIIRKQVSYNANGGTGDVPASKTKRSGTTVEVNLSTVPTREGYGFAGWATSASATTPTYTSEGTTSFTMPEEDVTLYAVWQANRHTLVYNVNGGEEGTQPTAEAVSYGQVVNIDLSTLPERTGYRFIGYAETENATEATYKTGGTTSITIPDRDVTIYAVWEILYTISYNANGGTGNMNPTVDNPAVVEANGFIVPSGYIFKEWNTNENGTGTTYAVGTTLNQNITLYAIWQVDLQVSVNANGLATTNTTIKPKPNSNVKITIPAGFAPVILNGSNTTSSTTSQSGRVKSIIPANEWKNITVEQINAGIVVVDHAITSTNGVQDYNEYVWIPVDGSTITYAQHTYATRNANDTSWLADTGNGNWPTYYYRNYSLWKNKHYTSSAYEDEMSTNTTSVAKYGGFYIGRYEAGWEPVTANTTRYTNSKPIGTSKVPSSKYGYSAWNHITQYDASTACDRLSTSSVRARLIDGYAWDTTVNYISNAVSSVIDSSPYGNYLNGTATASGITYKYSLYRTAKSGGATSWVYNNIYYRSESNAVTLAARTLSESSTADMALLDTLLTEAGYSLTDKANYTYRLSYELTTGTAESTKVKNIYDIAGNMWEWTSEVGGRDTLAESSWTNSTKTFAVLRGGSFAYGGSSNPVSYRYGSNNVSRTDFHVGFRAVLYVK